jgi:hypothetical protein
MRKNSISQSCSWKFQDGVGLTPWRRGLAGSDLGPLGPIWIWRAPAVLPSCAWVRPGTSSLSVLLGSERMCCCSGRVGRNPTPSWRGGSRRPRGAGDMVDDAGWPAMLSEVDVCSPAVPQRPTPWWHLRRLRLSSAPLRQPVPLWAWLPPTCRAGRAAGELRCQS